MRLTVIGLLVLGLGVIACSRAEEERPDAPAGAAPAAEDTMSDEASGEVAAAPGVAPSGQDAGRPAMRNWVLLEFVRPVEEADLQWLAENGFRVDTVMGEKLVRGWLEASDGGEVIARDGRIARVSAQAR